MATRDEGFRARMVQFMLLCALVLNPLPEEIIDRVDDYARELGVGNDMLRVAHRLARGNYGLALIDFQRSGYMATWDPSRSAVLHTSRELADAWEQCVRDEVLAMEWEALRELPEGTLGRAVVRFYDARGFQFPGRQGSAPPLLAQHDWVHVLAGYGSTVESEIEVFAFISRANDDPNAFSLLAQIVSLFETGYTPSGMGLFQYDRGYLSHEGMAVRLADAMRRGAMSAAANHSIDFLAVDWFTLADRPIDDVRAELGIVEKSDRAIEMGSVTAWEAGGISEFQYAAGQKAAADAGRDYESHGAVPA
jgi:ubiquinone biosynthesis protein Coq4